MGLYDSTDGNSFVAASKSQEDLARKWLLKPYQLIDIHRMSNEELQQHI